MLTDEERAAAEACVSMLRGLDERYFQLNGGDYMARLNIGLRLWNIGDTRIEWSFGPNLNSAREGRGPSLESAMESSFRVGEDVVLRVKAAKLRIEAKRLERMALKIQRENAGLPP